MPGQIAGWLKRGEETGLRPVSPETVYAFIHRTGQKAEKLWRLLPRGRAKRGRKRARAPRPPSVAPSTTGPRTSKAVARRATGRATS